MAGLDVSELMTDPDFASTVDIITTVQSIGAHGRVVNTPTVYEREIAIVQAGSGQRLALLADGSRISDSITVYSQRQLKAADAGHRIADVVVWKGQRFMVKNVASWEGWGAGYSRADCEWIGVNPTTPSVIDDG
jgi:hypothetical protein